MTSFIIFCFSAIFFVIEVAINCLEVVIVCFCSRIRSRDFEKSLDIVIDQCDFEENFCDIVGSHIELDISVERPVYFSDFIEKDSQCDYYQKIYKPGDLFVCFTSVLVRLYVNNVLVCLNLI